MTDTYGASRGAEVLAEIIAEQPERYKLSRKVGRLLSQFHKVAGRIEAIADREVVVVLYNLTAAHYCATAKELFSTVPKVSTFTQNVIQARRKHWLEAHPHPGKKKANP